MGWCSVSMRIIQSLLWSVVMFPISYIKGIKHRKWDKGSSIRFPSPPINLDLAPNPKGIFHGPSTLPSHTRPVLEAGEERRKEDGGRFSGVSCLYRALVETSKAVCEKALLLPSPPWDRLCRCWEVKSLSSETWKEVYHCISGQDPETFRSVRRVTLKHNRAHYFALLVPASSYNRLFIV